MRNRLNDGVVVAQVALALALAGCSAGGSGGGANQVTGCVAGAAIACTCSDGRSSTTMCLADGSGYAPCVCLGGAAGVPVANSAAGAGGMTAPQATGAGGAPPIAGRGGTTGAVGGMGGGAAGSAGRVGAAGMLASAGAGGAAGAAGSGSGLSMSDLDMLRQTCVDEINMYRATLSLKPLKRATAAQEMCSDTGAQMDGDSMMAHASARAGLCRSVGLGAEDTCPGWGVGGFSGNATVADALKACLKAMWGEGMPPVSRAMCIMDSSGCFQMYGHYLNMSDPNAGSVACSFYKMKSGEWWMNQDFAQ